MESLADLVYSRKRVDMNLLPNAFLIKDSHDIYDRSVFEKVRMHAIILPSNSYKKKNPYNCTLLLLRTKALHVHDLLPSLL